LEKFEKEYALDAEQNRIVSNQKGTERKWWMMQFGHRNCIGPLTIHMFYTTTNYHINLIEL